jgi:hypothetical protein
MWRQLRGRVQLQNGTSIALGDGQPGLADLGGIMTVEWQRYSGGGPGQLLTSSWQRCNLYVEGEIKTCGNVPPSAREYTGDSKRKLTPTEQDQITRQQAQLARGGFYCFADRAEELVDALVRYRDDVVARMS